MIRRIPLTYHPSAQRARWQPALAQGPYRRRVGQTGAEKGAVRALEAVVDTALYGAVAYLGIHTGLKQKATTLGIIGWVVGVMGAAKGILSLAKLYTLATAPPAAPATDDVSPVEEPTGPTTQVPAAAA